MKVLNKKILSVILFAFLALLLLKMNNIVAFFFPQQLRLQKVNFEEYNVEGKAYVYMNPYEYNDKDLKEVVRCSGWAFAETEDTNEDKSVYLILKGEKNTYKTERCGRAPDDIHREFPEWKRIPGKANNFHVDFSTVILPEDTYEIYVYVEENEKTKAISSTGQGFKKEGVKLYNYAIGEKKEAINPEPIDGQFDYGWITITTVNDCIEARGWAAIEARNSEDSDYYIVYVGDNNKNVTIHVANWYRTEVAKHLENDIYIASGLTGRLDRKSLPDKKGFVYVVAENQGEWYRTDSYTYDIDLQEDEGRAFKLSSKVLQ